MDGIESPSAAEEALAVIRGAVAISVTRKRRLARNFLLDHPLHIRRRKLSKKKALTEAEMARLTAAITTRQKRKKQYCFEYRQLLFALMLSPPFCRRGEARALHWEDIYDGKIHVRRQYDHDHWKLTGERFKDSTKTGKDRIVPLNDWVGRALMPVWERQGRPATGHIFVSRWGGPVALNRLFFYTMRKAGLVAASGGARAKIRLHDLRGIGETLCLYYGGNHKQVAAWAGHSEEILRNAYERLLPGDERSIQGVAHVTANIGQKMLAPPEKIVSRWRRDCYRAATKQDKQPPKLLNLKAK